MTQAICSRGRITRCIRAAGTTDAPIVDRRIEDHDSVPLGDVEIRRGDHVHATDGTIGKVHGLIIDPRDHNVTHFLLEEGHLWGHKTVAIPITAVDRLDDGVRRQPHGRPGARPTAGRARPARDLVDEFLDLAKPTTPTKLAETNSPGSSRGAIRQAA